VHRQARAVHMMYYHHVSNFAAARGLMTSEADGNMVLAAQFHARMCYMRVCRCKAEASQLLKTEFGEFTVDNRCWIRTGFSLTQVCTHQSGQLGLCRCHWTRQRCATDDAPITGRGYLCPTCRALSKMSCASCASDAHCVLTYEFAAAAALVLCCR
jgi:hypothetical protein